MASKRRNMFYKNKTQETRENVTQQWDQSPNDGGRSSSSPTYIPQVTSGTMASTTGDGYGVRGGSQDVSSTSTESFETIASGFETFLKESFHHRQSPPNGHRVPPLPPPPMPPVHLLLPEGGTGSEEESSGWEGGAALDSAPSGPGEERLPVVEDSTAVTMLPKEENHHSGPQRPASPAGDPSSNHSEADTSYIITEDQDPSTVQDAALPTSSIPEQCTDKTHGDSPTESGKICLEMREIHDLAEVDNTQESEDRSDLIFETAAGEGPFLSQDKRGETEASEPEGAVPEGDEKSGSSDSTAEDRLIPCPDSTGHPPSVHKTENEENLTQVGTTGEDPCSHSSLNDYDSRIRESDSSDPKDSTRPDEACRECDAEPTGDGLSSFVPATEAAESSAERENHLCSDPSLSQGGNISVDSNDASPLVTKRVEELEGESIDDREEDSIDAGAESDGQSPPAETVTRGDVTSPADPPGVDATPADGNLPEVAGGANDNCEPPSTCSLSPPVIEPTDLASPQLDSSSPLELASPQLDSSSPQELASPQLDSSSPQELASPQLDSSSPQELASPQLDSSSPQELASPQRDSSSPQELASPQLDSSSPQELASPQLDSSSPQELASPQLDSSSPQELASPQLDSSSPQELASPQRDSSSPQELASPQLDSSSPQELASPQRDSSSPQELASPQLDSSSPQELASPQLDSSSPQELASPQLDSSSPQELASPQLDSSSPQELASPQRDSSSPQELASPQLDSSSPQELASPQLDSSSPQELASPQLDSSSPQELASPQLDSSSPQELASPQRDSSSPQELASPQLDSSSPQELASPQLDSSSPQELASPQLDSSSPQELASPQLDNSSPAVLTCPQLDSSSPPDLAKPQFDNSSPVDLANPQLDNSSPADLANPQLDNSSPVDLASPQLANSSPVDLASPQLDSSSPADLANPQFDSSSPPDLASPQLENSSPADLADPQLDSSSPQELANPQLDSSSPADLANPQLDSSSPPDLANPQLENSSPADLANPQVDSSSPQELASPQLDSSSPQELESPQLDSSGPADLACPQLDSSSRANLACPQLNSSSPADVVNSPHGSPSSAPNLVTNGESEHTIDPTPDLSQSDSSFAELLAPKGECHSSEASVAENPNRCESIEFNAPAPHVDENESAVTKDNPIDDGGFENQTASTNQCSDKCSDSSACNIELEKGDNVCENNAQSMISGSDISCGPEPEASEKEEAAPEQCEPSDDGSPEYNAAEATNASVGEVEPEMSERTSAAENANRSVVADEEVEALLSKEEDAKPCLSENTKLAANPFQGMVSRVDQVNIKEEEFTSIGSVQEGKIPEYTASEEESIVSSTSGSTIKECETTTLGSSGEQGPCVDSEVSNASSVTRTSEVTGSVNASEESQESSARTNSPDTTTLTKINDGNVGETADTSGVVTDAKRSGDIYSIAATDKISQGGRLSVEILRAAIESDTGEDPTTSDVEREIVRAREIVADTEKAGEPVSAAEILAATCANSGEEGKMMDPLCQNLRDECREIDSLLLLPAKALVRNSAAQESRVIEPPKVMKQDTVTRVMKKKKNNTTTGFLRKIARLANNERVVDDDDDDGDSSGDDALVVIEQPEEEIRTQELTQDVEIIRLPVKPNPEQPSEIKRILVDSMKDMKFQGQILKVPKFTASSSVQIDKPKPPPDLIRLDEGGASSVARRPTALVNPFPENLEGLSSAGKPTKWRQRPEKSIQVDLVASAGRFDTSAGDFVLNGSSSSWRNKNQPDSAHIAKQEKKRICAVGRAGKSHRHRPSQTLPSELQRAARNLHHQQQQQQLIALQQQGCDLSILHKLLVEHEYRAELGMEGGRFLPHFLPAITITPAPAVITQPPPPSRTSLEEAEVIDRLKRLGTVVEVEEQKTQDDVSSKCLKMLEKMARATDVADTPMSPIVMALRDHERPPPPVYVGKEISVSYTSEGGREIMGNANMYAPAMVVCESNLEDVSLLHEEGNLFEPVIDIVEGENHLGPDGTFAFRTSSYVDTSDLSQCYSCDICSAVYQHAHMLRKHYLRLHVARKYISERDMEHYNIDLEPDTEVQGDGARVERLIFRCHTCRRCFSGKTELKSHLTDHPPVAEIRKPSTKQQKQYKCPNCETTFKWRKVYGRHKKTCKPPEKPAPSVDTPSFHCLYCNETFFNANKKKNHVLSLHPYCRKRHACVFCKQDGYPTHSALFGHLISEHADVYFGCEECRERFAQMSELAAHNNEKHNAPLLPKTPAIDQRFYSCSTCDRIYLVESSFSEHYPICLNPPPPKVTPPLPSPTSQEVARRGKSRKGKSGGKAKLEEVDPETLFYSRVSGNIRDNLLHHLDGKLDTIRVLSDSDPANSDARARKLMHFSAGFSSPTSPDGEHNDKEEASPNSAAARAKTPWEKYSFPKNYDGRCGLTSYIKDTSYLDISTQLIMRRNLQRLNMLPIIKEAQPTGASEGEGEEDVPSVLALERLGAQCAESFGEVKRIKNEETETTVLGELSGEWVRDRTYICSVCGWETPCLWSMEDHKYEIHPNVLCPQHELVGDDRDLSKLIYTRLVSAPPLFSPRRGGVTPSGPLPPATEAKCTKCGQSGFKGPSDLHLHIMECAGEDLGIVAGIPGGSQRTSSGRRKWRSTRKRRSGRRGLKRNIPSTPQRPPQKLRTKPGDTDTIQKMIANLPAKRITRRVIGFDEIEIKTRSQATIQNAPTPNGIQRTVKPNKPKQIKQEQTHTFASSRHLMVSQPLTKKEEPRIDSTRKVTDFIDTSAERGDVLSSLRMMPVKVKKPSVDDSTETESSMVIVSQKSEKEVEKEQDIVQKVAMCTGCGVCFEAKAALKRHHKSCVYYRESRPDNPCKSCNLSFPFLTALLEHNCQKDTGAPPRQMPKLEIEKDLAPVNSSEIPVLSPIAETAVEPPREVITDPKTRGENKPCHTPPPLIPKVPILEIPRPPPVGPILEIPRDSFIGISFIGGKIKYETLSSVSEETEKLEMGGVVFDKELVKKTKSPAKVLQKLSRKQKGLGGQKLQTGRKRKIGHEVGATEGEPKSKKPRVSKKKVVQQGEESANIELSPKKKRKYVRKLSVTPVKQEEEGQVKSSETSPAVETPSTPSVKKRKPGRPFGSVTKKSSGGSPLDLRPKRTRKSCGNGNDEKRRVSGRLGVVQKGNKKNDISLDSDKNTDEVAQSNIIKEDESVVKTDPELKDKTEDRSGDKEMEVNVKDEQEDESQPDENATRVGEDIKVDELKDEPEVGVVSEAEAEVVEERKKRRSRGSPASRRKKDTVKVTASGNQNGTQEVKTEVDPDKEFRQQEVDSPCSKSKSSSSRSNPAGRRSTAVNNVVDGAQVVESMAENDTEKCDEGDVVSLLEVPKNRRRSFRGSPATRSRKDIVKTGVESHLSTISKKEDDSDVVKNDLEEHDSPLERVTTPVLEESKSKRYCSRSASTRLNRKDDGAGSSHLNKVQELENIGEPRNDIVKEGDVELDQKPKNKGCLENSPTNRKRKVDTEYLADTSLEETCYNSTGKDSKNCDETAAELVLEEPKNRWTNRPSRTRRKVVSEEALGDEVRIETEETTVTEPVETPEMLGKTQDDENKALIPEQPKSKKRNSRQSPANNKKRGVLAEGSNVSEVELGGKCPETQTYVIHETNIPPVVIEEPKNRKLCGKQNSPGIRNNDLDGSSLGKAEEEISNTTESMAMTQGESTDKTVVSDGQVEQLSVECEKNPTGDGLLNEYSERGSIIESTVIGPEVDGVKGEVDTSASEKLNVTTCSKEVKSEGVEQAEQDVEMDESKGPDVAIDSQIDETSSRGEERKKKCRKATVKKEMADTSFDIDDGCCSVRTKKRKLEKKCVKPKRKHHLLLLETEFSSSESQSESGGDYTRKLKKLKDPLLGVKRSTNNMILKKKKKLLKLKNKIVTGGDREVIKVGPFKWEVSTFSRFSPKKDSDQCSNCHGNEPRNTGQKDNLCRSDSGSNKNNPATDNTDPSTLESSVPQIFSATPPSATEVGSSCKPSCESLPLKTGSSLGFDRSSDTTAEAPFPSAPSCGGVDLAVPTSCSEDVTYRLPPARSISPIWSQQLWEGNSSETQAQTNVNPSLGTILDSVNKLLSEPESTYTPLMLPQYSLADLQKAMGASDAEMAVLQQLGEASLQDTEESGSGGGNVLIKDEEEWATEGCSIMDLDNQPPQPAQPSSRQDGVSSSTSPPNTTQTPLVSSPPHQFQASATSTGTNSTQHPTSFGNHHPQTIGLSMSSAPSLSFKDEIMASLSMHNSRHRTSPSVSNSNNLLAAHSGKEVVCPTCSCHFMGFPALQVHVNKAHSDIPNSTPAGFKPKARRSSITVHKQDLTTLNRRVVLESAKESRLICFVCQQILPSNLMCSHLVVEHSLKSVDITKCTSVTGEMPNSDGSVGGERLKSKMSSALDGLLERAVNNLLSAKKPGSRLELSGGVVQLLTKLCAVRGKDVGGDAATNTSFQNRIRSNSKDIFRKLKLESSCDNSNSSSSSWGSSSAVGTASQTKQYSKSYNCAICGEKFPLASTRNRHVLQAHTKSAVPSEDRYNSELFEYENDWREAPSPPNSFCDSGTELPCEGETRRAVHPLCSDCGLSFRSIHDMTAHRLEYHTKSRRMSTDSVSLVSGSRVNSPVFIPGSRRSSVDAPTGSSHVCTHPHVVEKTPSRKNKICSASRGGGTQGRKRGGGGFSKRKPVGIGRGKPPLNRASTDVEEVKKAMSPPPAQVELPSTSSGQKSPSSVTSPAGGKKRPGRPKKVQQAEGPIPPKKKNTPAAAVPSAKQGVSRGICRSERKKVRLTHVGEESVKEKAEAALRELNQPKKGKDGCCARWNNAMTFTRAATGVRPASPTPTPPPQPTDIYDFSEDSTTAAAALAAV